MPPAVRDMIAEADVVLNRIVQLAVTR